MQVKEEQSAPLIMKRADLRKYTPEWAKDAILDLETELGKKKSDFPCPYATQNFNDDTLRFVFLEDSSPTELDRMRRSLLKYLSVCSSFGELTSFICVFKPEAQVTIADYESWFWSVLQYLHDHDESPWPEGYPTDPEDPSWAFCFGYEGQFIVCTTPVHQQRKSRRSLVPMITFTPHWNFIGLGVDTKRGIAMRKLVREKVTAYDGIPTYPYGNEVDWRGYFIPDTNDFVEKAFPLLIRQPA